ncbi:MAG: hypothetical protein JWN33_59 [Candidatus Saccharibacteria bacterium]|nr:hypothetical protein [Candidatus Saccharibacteria bacterium]
MKITDIDLLPIKKHFPLNAKRVRARAPKLIASVINDTDVISSVPSIRHLRPEHIQALSGGVDAATYLVSLPKEQVIIKLSYIGVDAEAEAIEAWRKRHVRVPRMIKTGVVPSTRNDKYPVKYLVQQALLDDTGRLIETCATYLTRAPHKARKIGVLLGRELDKLHSCVSDRRFGDFNDTRRRPTAYDTWNDYVYTAIKKQKDYLVSIGVSREDLRAVLRFVKSYDFVRKGRYLHGDFSIRNVAVKSYDPLKISVFDPNPIIGDPTWDVSFIWNNYQFEKRRIAVDKSQHDLFVRNQQLWIGFKQGYNRTIDEGSLAVSSVIQAIYQAQYTEGIKDAIGAKVRKEYIKDRIAFLLEQAEI